MKENNNINDANFLSNFFHGVFKMHEPVYKRNERIEILSKDIEQLLNEKEKLEIPEIMEEFNIRSIDAIAAIEILKEKGIVVNSNEL